MAGVHSDRFGCKNVLLLSAVIFALSADATQFSNGLGEFVAARIVAGVTLQVSCDPACSRP